MDLRITNFGLNKVFISPVGGWICKTSLEIAGYMFSSGLAVDVNACQSM